MGENLSFEIHSNLRNFGSRIIENRNAPTEVRVSDDTGFELSIWFNNEQEAQDIVVHWLSWIRQDDKFRMFSSQDYNQRLKSEVE